MRVFSEHATGYGERHGAPVQGPDGSVYFSGSQVIRFDGSKWHALENGKSGISSALAFDEQGRLWVSARSEIGYFTASAVGVGAFVSLAKHFPRKDSDGGLPWIWSILPGSEGVVFVGDQSVYVWNGESFRQWDFTGGRRLVGYKLGDESFIGSTEIGVLRLSGGRWESVVSPEIFKRFPAMWLERIPGGFRMLCNSGLVRVVDGAVVETTNEVAAVTAGIVSGAARIDEGTLVAATVNSGMVFCDNDGRILWRLNAGNGLPTDFTLHALVDRDGSIWTLTEKEILQLVAPRLVSRFSAENGIAGGVITSVLSDAGRVWVSTGEGVFMQQATEGGHPARFEPVAGRKSFSFASAVLNDGLVTSDFDGVWETRNGERRRLYFKPKEARHVFPSRTRENAAYLAHLNELAFIGPDATGALKLLGSVPTPVLVESVAEGDDGTLWLGSAAGIFRVSHEAFEAAGNSRSPEKVIPEYSGSAIVARVGRSIVAFFSSGAAVLESDGTIASSIDRFENLTAQKTAQAEADGPLWIQFLQKNANGNQRSIVSRLTAAPGEAIRIDWFEIPGLQTAGAIRAFHADGSMERPALWIGGTEGLVRVELNRLDAPEIPRPPLLHAEWDDGGAADSPSPEVQLPFSNNRLTFEFASTEFSRLEALRYQTRLFGLEPDWSAPTRTTRREYPFLQDGEYRFEVRMVSDSALVGPASSWSFRIMPPWYRTGWAYGGYFLLGMVLLVGADRFRVNALKRRNRWLEEQVRIRTAELEKANAAKTEFVARVNHDIRNPINGVLGVTAALESTPLNPEQQKMAATIRQCGRFLSALVEEVLDFAEIESGAIKLKAEAFDLGSTLAACVATVEPLANDGGSELLIEIDQGLPPVLVGDPARLQQILVNFLSNAVKFGNGKPVVLKATPLHELAGRRVVRIGVRDQGPGIGPEEQKQLFVKFSRLRFAEEKKIKGTGLGLAVCRLLAERMGGRVGVESEPGNGAEFFLELPFEVGSEVGADEPSPVAANARVLVVEDEEYNAISLVSMLGRMGFHVDRCSDGLSALEQLRRQRYEIVFLDWEMPKLNGIEVARRFRAEESGERRTLIIATTAYASEDKRRACLDAGMDEFVAKPLTPDRITAAIRGHGGPFRPATSILVREEPGTLDAGLDLSLFAYLADGTEGGLAAKVDRFIADCESELNELSSYVGTGRSEELRRGAHRFLSQCRFVGATRLAELALSLEVNAYQPDSPEVARIFSDLRSEFDSFNSKLRSSLASRATASVQSRSQT